MEIALLVLVLFTLGGWWILRNAQATLRQVRSGDGVSEAIEELWNGWSEPEQLGPARAQLAKLLRDVPLSRVTGKRDLVRLGLMASQCDHLELLEKVAARALLADLACGETRALAALAEAGSGDHARAGEMLREAAANLSGCAGCGGTLEGKLLLQELSLAAESLSLELPAAPVCAPAGLTVRRATA